MLRHALTMMSSMLLKQLPTEVGASIGERPNLGGVSALEVMAESWNQAHEADFLSRLPAPPEPHLPHSRMGSHQAAAGGMASQRNVAEGTAHGAQGSGHAAAGAEAAAGEFESTSLDRLNEDIDKMLAAVSQVPEQVWVFQGGSGASMPNQVWDFHGSNGAALRRMAHHAAYALIFPARLVDATSALVHEFASNRAESAVAPAEGSRRALSANPLDRGAQPSTETRHCAAPMPAAPASTQIGRQSYSGLSVRAAAQQASHVLPAWQDMLWVA